MSKTRDEKGKKIVMEIKYLCHYLCGGEIEHKGALCVNFNIYIAQKVALYTKVI